MEALGFLVYDLLLVAIGWSVLVAVEPTIRLQRLLPSTGLAFWIGLSTVGLIGSFVAVLGPAPSRLSVSLIAAAAAAIAVLRRRSSRSAATAQPPPPRLTWPAAVGYGLVGLVAAAQIAAAWYRPATEWDGWAFWIPKARLLFTTGHLKASLWTQYSGTTYPPLLPVVHAGAFAFMGAADEVLLHVQAAIFLAAFLQAVSVLARRYAPDVYVVPLVLLAASLPWLSRYVLQLDGDYPTELLFALSALVCAAFLVSGRRELLVPAALLLGADANSRREGLIYACAIGAAALVAGAVQRWRPLWLAFPAAFALVAAVPWLLWVRVHHVVADAAVPPKLIGSTANQSDTGAISQGLGTVIHYVFRFGSWSVAPYVGFAALILGLRRWRRDSGLASFLASTTLIVILGLLWRLLWYGGGLNVNGTPIPRIAGVLSLFLLAVGPLLLTSAFGRPRLPVTWLARTLSPAVGGAAVTLPAVVLLGVEGAHLHAIRTLCDPPPAATSPAYVVFGYSSDYADALRLQSSVARRGFDGTTLGVDLCGRLRVQSGPLPTLDAARELQQQARAARLATSLTSA
jgi:hypothetical protein